MASYALFQPPSRLFDTIKIDEITGRFVESLVSKRIFKILRRATKLKIAHQTER